MISTKSSSLTEDISNEVSPARPPVSPEARVSFRSSPASIYSVLTDPSLREAIILPLFIPAMPPASCAAAISPRDTHLLIRPLSCWRPAMPPAVSFPATLPSKLQFCIDPALSPAIPPRTAALPSGSILPFTFRFRMTAPSPTYRKKPRTDPCS